MSPTSKLTASLARPVFVAALLGFSLGGIAGGAVQPDVAERQPESNERLTSLAGVASVARLVDLVAARFGVAITYDEASVNLGKIVIRKERPIGDDELWLLTNRLLGEQGLCITRGSDGATYAVAKIAVAAQTVLAEDVDLATFVPGRLVGDDAGRERTSPARLGISARRQRRFRRRPAAPARTRRPSVPGVGMMPGA